MMKGKKKEKQNREMTEKEKEALYRKISSRMTADPIMDDFLRPEVLPFLIFYETPEVLSALYIMEKLYPHWKEIVEKAPIFIEDMHKELDNLDKIFDKYEKKSETEHPFPLNYINLDIYRKYATLYPIWISTKHNLFATRRAILIQRVEILQALYNICAYLLENPRYIAVRSYTAFQDWKSLEADLMPTQYIKYHSIKFAVYDLAYQNKCLPRPFSNKEQNVSLLSHIVTNCIAAIDPASGYIPFTDDYYVFSYFLESKVSPFNIAQKIQIQVTAEDIPGYASEMNQAIAEFIGIDEQNPDQESMMRVINQLCVRYLFDKYFLIELERKTNEKFEAKFAEMKNLTLTQLGLNKPFIPQEFHDLTCSQFTEKEQYLLKAQEFFDLVVFQTFPSELSHLLYQVGLCLGACIAQWTNTSFDASKSFDDLIVLWKIVFLSTNCEGFYWLITALEHYSKLNVITQEEANSSLVPRALIMMMS